MRHPGEINTNHGGRGVYFDDPSGHHFELITQPYGATSSGAERGAIRPRGRRSDPWAASACAWV